MTLTHREPLRLRTGIALALLTWLYHGVIIGNHDLRAYTLQHAGVEALVERGTFDVSGSDTPQLRGQLGDTFWYRGRLLAAKQPGQFTLGALPYVLLSALGITYRSNYDLAAALTTWLSSGLATASAVFALWWLLAGVFAYSSGAAARAALCYGLGSTATAYAGVAHHDVIASALLIWSLCCVENSRARDRSDWLALSGVLLGLVLCTSFLAAPITATLLIYAGSTALRPELRGSTRLYRIGSLACGLLLGLLPLGLYNLHYFGDPLLQANVAGHYTDTFFSWDRERFYAHLDCYLGTGQLSVWKYVPLVAAGACGVALFPARLSRQRLFIAAAVLAHFVFVLNIETIGHCQYGPRYTLPAQAMTVIGVAELFRRSVGVRWLRLILHAALVASCLINSVGALGGTMNCFTRSYAFPIYLADWQGLTSAEFPLRRACSVLIVLLGLALARRQRFIRKCEGRSL